MMRLVDYMQLYLCLAKVLEVYHYSCVHMIIAIRVMVTFYDLI